jgi:CO/xanthine dehydrogenase FAD-binding subunit
VIEYFTPTTLDEAINLLASHQQSRVIAGGTDLLIDLQKGKKRVQVLVDVTHIPDLNQIRIENGFVEVGAAVTFEAIKNHDYFKRYIPMLAEAAGSVGALGIQTTATWVGNLVQAMPAADGAIVALSLEAEAKIVEQGKRNWIPVTSLFVGAGKSVIDSSRQIVTHLRFMIPSRAWGTAWQRIGRRAALTLPTINCAVKVEMDGEKIRRAVIALGPVSSTPFRAKHTESFLADKFPTRENLDAAGKIAQGESDPRGNPLRAPREYRLAIIPVVVRRALSIAVERAQKSNDMSL